MIKKTIISIVLSCFIFVSVLGNFFFAFAEELESENTKIIMGKGVKRLQPENNETWQKRMKQTKSGYVSAGMFIGMGMSLVFYDFVGELLLDKDEIYAELGCVVILSGIGAIFYTMKKRKDLKILGKEKGWTLTMNRNNELMLAYNVYWK